MNAFHPHSVARRSRQAAGVLSLTFAVLLVAFFRTQILAHERFATQSVENRLRPVRIPAPRGVIMDRHGEIIAENVPGYTVALLPGPRDSLLAVLRQLAPLLAFDSTRIAAVLERHERAPYLPVTVLRDAPLAAVSMLEERRLLLPGLVVQTDPKRHYPDGDAVAHLVGYVSEATEREVETLAGDGVTYGGIVGRDGLERQYDTVLRGKDGYRLIEVSAFGRLVREADSSLALVPVPGRSIQTTIDLPLQRFVARVFPRGRRGAIVALDPHTGGILAMYSSPVFDPNEFVGGIAAERWRALTTDEARPLLDRTIQTRYPPGSTFKLALAAMALERGVATLGSRMPEPCRGGFQYGNRYFRCWYRQGHGSLDLRGAIAHSCNVFFYQLGLKLGLSTMLSEGTGMGFGRRSGVDLPFEIDPLYPAGTDYYDRRYGHRGWTQAAALNIAVGQGEHAQTLMNLVRFYAALANGGRQVTPHLVGSRIAGERLFDLNTEQLASLRQILVSVVEEGTARASRLRELQIAGKTGTAENPHGKGHGWFVGFAPADDPKIVVGVLVEFGEHGSWVAPIGAGVMAYHLVGPDAARDLPYHRLQMPLDTAPPPMALIAPSREARQ